MFSIITLAAMLWRRYVRGIRPGDASRIYLDSIPILQKLIQSGQLEIDTRTPYVFLSSRCYEAFLCKSDGYSPDDRKAGAFMHRVLFYVNYTNHCRIGMAGMSQADAKTYTSIDFAVASGTRHGIILVGRYDGEKDITYIKPYERNKSNQGLQQQED